MQEPVYGQYPSGAQLGELDKESSFLTDLYSIPARKEYADSRVESDKEFPNYKMRKDTRDGDVDKESNFYVLIHTAMPAILSENFFMTNEKECKTLLLSEYLGLYPYRL